jgi:hypothetical protein
MYDIKLRGVAFVPVKRPAVKLTSRRAEEASRIVSPSRGEHDVRACALRQAGEALQQMRIYNAGQLVRVGPLAAIGTRSLQKKITRISLSSRKDPIGSERNQRP